MSVTQLTADEYVESITEGSYDIPQFEGVYDLVESLEEEYPTGEEKDLEPQDGRSFSYERAVEVLNNVVCNFVNPEPLDNTEVVKTNKLAREGDYEELRTHLEEVNL
ncbi:MAG: hypothetical protein BRC27_02535 [Nanohaloarchaea archaeon SW_10_44_10]|nr:MAG: hypothetical protein BRC27_02535 [Nanohaloarchaea archaeon SW_10_44_10]